MTILSLLGAGLIDYVSKGVGNVFSGVLGVPGALFSNGCAAASNGVTYGLDISTYVDVPTRVHRGRVPCPSRTTPTTTIVCNCNCGGRRGCNRNCNTCSATISCNGNTRSSVGSSCGCRG